MTYISLRHTALALIAAGAVVASAAYAQTHAPADQPPAAQQDQGGMMGQGA